MLINSLRQESIEQVLAKLTFREADILRKRYGLNDGECKTLETIGREYDLTRERVRQIQNKSLKRLRKLYIGSLIGE